MEAKGSSAKKDDLNETQERQHGRRKARPPHRFTKDELQILKQAFEENPYPTFTTKQELAKQLHCHLYVIQNWFQDRRYRLPPREKKRLFAIWKLNGFCVKRSQPLGSANSQVQSDNSSMNQTSLHDQETLPYRAGYSSLETQMIPSGHVGSGDSLVTGINREPRYPLEYQGAPASGPSCAYTPYSFIYPYPSMQCFESARYEARQSQNALPFFPHYAFTGQETGHQQEKYKAPDQYSVFQGQQPNNWGYHMQQLSQPQYYQENYQLPFQGQFFPYQNPSVLEQQEPNLPSEQQSNGGALSSLLQQAPVQRADRPPQLLGQGKQQVHAEHSGFEIQHFQNGVFPDVHF